MGKTYPHIDGATAFPGTGNVDVWRYQNTFDYDRWGDNVRIKVCSVPWCGDYENAVDFGSAEMRDAWFDSLNGTVYDLDTMVHVLPEQTIKLPVPAPALQPYNYLVVDLPRYTSDAQPVEYANGAWKSRYYFFLDNVVQRAASTSECVIRLDYWTTYVYDLTFDYVMLTRGHAPVAATDPDTYLSNPIANATYLLAPDVTYASPRIASRTNAVQFDGGDAYAVIVTAATFWDDWGDLIHPKVPSSMVVWSQGVCGNYAIACDVRDFETWCKNIDANCPQFLMTVQGVFFISKKCVEVLAIDFPASGVQCYQVHAAWQSEQLITLSKSDFNYPAEAARFAKLYTYPYSELVVTDGGGNPAHIRIEDTTGTLDLRYCVNLIMPWVSIDTQIAGVGGSAGGTVTFSNIGYRQWDYNGTWWDTVRRYSIPVYSVNQSALTHADYTTDYLREQAALAAANAKTSADASANTENANTVDASNTARTNAVDASNTARDNTHRSNQATRDAVERNNQCMENVQTRNAEMQNNIIERANSHIDAIVGIDNAMQSVVSDLNNDASAITSIANAGSQVIGGIASGATAGGVYGAAVGGVSSLGSTIAQGVTTAIAVTRNQRYNDVIIAQNTLKGAENKLLNTYNNSQTLTAINAATDEQKSAATDTTATTTGASDTNATNTNATDVANANRTNATEVANANRTLSTALANNQRSYDTAMAAITANLNQAGVNAPIQFGTRANGETCVTRPLTAMCSIVTQPTGAICQAAATFARYGYQLNQQWRVTSWQVMKHFTYWECSEVWCTGTGGAPEVAQQAIKDIISRGVTVWSDPADIGRVSIYDN